MSKSKKPSKQAPEKPRDAFTMLIQTLKSRKRRLKEAAIIMLGNLGDRRAVQPLLDLLACEEATLMRGRVITALGRIGVSKSRPTLMAIMKSDDESEWIRNSARVALGLKKEKRSRPLLPPGGVYGNVRSAG